MFTADCRTEENFRRLEFCDISPKRYTVAASGWLTRGKNRVKSISGTRTVIRLLRESGGPGITFIHGLIYTED